MLHMILDVIRWLVSYSKNIPVPMVGRCRNLGCWRPCAARDHGGREVRLGVNQLIFAAVDMFFHTYMYKFIYRIIKEYAI